MRFGTPIWLAAGLLAAALSGPAHAESQLKGLLMVGVTNGGTTLASGTYTSGDTWRIRSGGQLHFAFGLEVPTFSLDKNAPNMSVQTIVGYHVDQAKAASGDITFGRVPVELVLSWLPTPELRLGVGVRKSFHAELSSEGTGAMGNYAFRTSPGRVLQMMVCSPRGSGLVLRRVLETYHFQHTPINANHTEVGLVTLF